MYTTIRQPIRKLEIMEREISRLQEENNLLKEAFASCSPAHVRKQLAQAEENYKEYAALIQELSGLRQEYQRLNQELSGLRQEYQLLLQEAVENTKTDKLQKQRNWPRRAISQAHYYLRR